MSSTPHPTIAGVTVKEYEENGLPGRECAHADFAVYAEQDQGHLVFLNLDQGDVTTWVTVDEARVLATVILDTADWLAAQGATT